MDVADFWRFVERSADAESDPNRRALWLEDRLSRIALTHVVDFQIHLDAARRPIDTYDMWAAANQIMDGLCSGDSFWYFQTWLIGQGRRWWQHAARHPDNLVELPAMQALAGSQPGEWEDAAWPHWEQLACVASNAYDRVTGEEEGIDDALLDRGHIRPFDPRPDGVPWDSDSLAAISQRLPRLSRVFPRRRYTKP
ncbi:N-acetyltransferase GCN5 [Actinoplanes sp. SE50]|uniref:DUF4240 domain-containing protein n=1 Tax=unclassified Actinoplanes TaxID=2626549 RepID=UPI00023ED4C5|nr:MULTISPECIES: DUF4240 domain-containing protein [unclassified Actinoplanes]AEV86755.1 hypothetical protein ACPL_5868 [Actinoplanes sp. SE50/110]ATO85152.1 N-acetyltransferase GCN5 [Actinoplanes sp. SE50]SLM02563.1 hypothetical protein ACSP50_5813 [Actinoplanes sp. SE50/110]